MLSYQWRALRTPLRVAFAAALALALDFLPFDLPVFCVGGAIAIVGELNDEQVGCRWYRETDLEKANFEEDWSRKIVSVVGAKSLRF